MIICGSSNDKEVYIGSDSSTKSPEYLIQSSIASVFQKSDVLFGIFSSSNVIHHIYSRFIIPFKRSDMSLETYAQLFYNVFINHVSSYNVKVVALIGMHGKLFYMHTDEGIVECTEGYMAIGDGYAFALGSLYSTRFFGSDTSCYERVSLALTATHKHCPITLPPFCILGVHNDDVSDNDTLKIRVGGNDIYAGDATS